MWDRSGDDPGLWLEPPNFQSGVFALQILDQPLKSWAPAQVFYTRIDLEERPAREPGIDTLLQPCHRPLDIAEHGLDAAADIIKGADVRMVQGRDRPRLAFESSAESFVADFDGYLAVEASIERFVDCAHTPFSQKP